MGSDAFAGMSERMNCPYCHQEMVEGVICSPRTLSWTQRPLRTFSETEFTREGNVVLSEVGMLSPAKMKAWHCPACRKIVISY